MSKRSPTTRDAHPWVSRTAFIAAGVGMVAGVVRLRLLLDPSRYFYGTYDDGVHFTAAINLVAGHLPYKDFLFLQPPGIMILLSPFATVASLLGDPRAFLVARIAAVLAGVLSAVLVVLILKRFGASAQVVGGLLYALSWPAAYAERTITLESFGTSAILIAILCLQDSRRRRSVIAVAGAAAAVAVALKVWYIVPFILFAVASRRRVLWYILGGAAAGLAFYLPFFIQSPSQMWRDVVSAQIGRPAGGTPIEDRLRSLLGLDESATGLLQLAGWNTSVLLLGLLVVFVVLALMRPGARLFVALLVATGVVLLAAPSYFQHYATLTASPLALVAGAGVSQLLSYLDKRWFSAVAVALAVALALSVNLTPDLSRRNQKVIRIAPLQAAAASVRGCITADDPTLLILSNRLSYDLARGCEIQADPSGAGYVLTPAGESNPPRIRNPAFQREILLYLHSGTAYFFARGKALGLDDQSRAAVHNDVLIYKRGDVELRRTR